MRRLRSADKNFASRLSALARSPAAPAGVASAVSSLLAEVRAEGDVAVARCAKRFDGAHLRPRDFRLLPSALEAAWRRLPAPERRALRAAHAAIADFHAGGRPKAWRARNPQGAWVGEKFDPLRRVGLYVPGGQAPLVSTVLMTATLAKLAGCPEIAACTPSRADGGVAEPVLAALHLAGVREVYRVGGVQAIGAMAYGTASIRAVDKIFGPGNAYVCEAKRQVFGAVGIDSLPGPSELMILADGSARADFAAADLLAQAEHGSGHERIFLVATSGRTIAAIEASIESQLARLGRAEKIRRVLKEGFFAVETRSLDEAAAVANAIAPEHLQLMVRDSAVAGLQRGIVTAGAILAGNLTPTALGDFVAGPSHVLPTGGAGRFSGGLRVEDFLRRTSLVRYDRAALRRAAPTVAAFAAMEQLDAHGRSVEIRLED